ncbi:MAG: dual specificity protein phosphatase family protein [Deltaproteobacteria bacterium]|nr:dual specificity protein phosphatase family protein [Deltaproteobacteria bacterium]
MNELINAGIRHVINLMEEDERDHDGNLFTPYEKRFLDIAAAHGIHVTWERIPIQDVSVPTEQGMVKILDSIDRAMEGQRPVYVHCWGGKGRTGTVVGCYLVRHGLAVGSEALERIKTLRRHDLRAHEPSPETNQQRNFVCRWQMGK